MTTPDDLLPTLFLLDFGDPPAGAAKPLPRLAETLGALRARGARAVVAPGLKDLDALLRRFGDDPARTVVVGDEPSDVGAGRRAGCRTAGVLGGAGTREALVAAGADFVAEDLGALPHLRPALADRLRAAIPARRYAHSLGVAESARRLAARFGADEDRAWLAGLLHDCAKGIPTDAQVAECDRRGVALDADARRCPAVAHGFLGAELARTEYGVTDPEVLGAIRLHTVGGAGMRLLEKIVWLADYVEPNRAFPGVDELRAAAAGPSLDAAMRLAVRRQMEVLAAKAAPAHPGLFALRDELERS